MVPVAALFVETIRPLELWLRDLQLPGFFTYFRGPFWDSLAVTLFLFVLWFCYRFYHRKRSALQVNGEKGNSG